MRPAPASGHTFTATSWHREIVFVSATVAATLLFGVLSAVQPQLAVALIALLIVGLLPFLFPVGHLLLLVFVLAALPFELQNTYGFGGGTGAVGVVLSDLLLAGGLARAMLVLGRQRVSPLQAAAILSMLLFLLVVMVQLIHGVQRGSVVSEAGTEARAMLGYGAFLVALPLLQDQRHRWALLRGLVGLGILLGAVGLAQVLFGVSYGGSGDFGVREGVQLTSSEGGQLQGGLFGYPVVIVMGVAALAARTATTLRGRVALGTAVTLSTVCLLLTYERTFWLATAAGCALVVARAGEGRRRILVSIPVIVALVFIPLASFSPDTLTTARERLMSLGQYSTDGSVYYRLVESRNVIDQVDERPLAGSGLGASIYWGRPLYRVPPERYTFIHNGFLYVAWKLGTIIALMLVGAIVGAIARSRRRFDHAVAPLVAGAQGALLALLIGSLTFPTIASLSSNATIGVLLAICLASPHLQRTADQQRGVGPG